MKKQYILLILLLAGCILKAKAQPCPAEPNFDWEDPTAGNWTATFGFGGQPTTTRLIGSPWTNAHGSLNTMKQSGDYTRNEGWILMRKDFGCTNLPTRVPYFILYNQYRSLIRVFAYFDENELKSGSTFIIKHNSSSFNSATLNFTKELALSSDEYQLNGAADNDLGTYSNKNLFPKWFYGEFPIAFDPNFNANNGIWSLEINVVNTSNITQQGSLHWNTEASDGSNGVSSSKSDKGSDGGPFTDIKADHGKLTAYLPTYDAFKKTVDSLNNKIPFTNYKPMSDLSDKLKVFSNSPIQTILDANALTGTVVDIASSLYSLFTGGTGSDSNGKTTFTPTVTSGTISLSGTITQSNNLLPVDQNIPGQIHSSTDDNNPYFEAPLGIMTIRSSPTLFVKKWTAPFTVTKVASGQASEDCGTPLVVGTPNPFQSTYVNFYSYELQNNIEVLLNGANNEILELKNVEACLEGKVKNSTVLALENNFFPYKEKLINFFDLDTLKKVYFQSSCTYVGALGYPQTDIATFSVTPTENIFQDQFKNGLIITEAPVVQDGDPGSTSYVMIRTPFRNISCLQHTTLTLPEGSSVSNIKVRAVFKRKDTGKEVLVVLSFKVNAVTQPNSAEPYFPAFNQSQPEVINLGTADVTSGTYAATQSVSSAGKVTGSSTSFVAQKFVDMLPGFDSNYNTFDANIQDFSCDNDMKTIIDVPMNQHFKLPTGHRRGKFITEPSMTTTANDLITFPNPFSNSVQLKFTLARDSKVDIILYNQLMQPTIILKDYQGQAGEHTLSREFTKFPAGVYFVTLKAGDFTTTRKIVKTEATE